MTTLVTGGTGLVGYAIQSILNNKNYIFLSSKDCDLTNYKNTYEMFNKYKPKYVIHLAANVGGLYKNMNKKVDMYEKNIMINMNVLRCSHLFKVKKLISCLSTCIFPDKTIYPINEKMLHNGPPHHSNDTYSYSKRMLEIQSKAYQEQFNNNFICIIPTNIYGENDNYNLRDGHVIPALIHKCYLAKKNKDYFIVKGSGKPLRQFIYSKDLANLILWTMDNYDEKESIILSVDEKDEISIKDVAILIAEEFKYSHMIKFDLSYSDGQYKKTADNSKLKKLYPDVYFTDIKYGIKESVKWFIKNYNNCRK